MERATIQHGAPRAPRTEERERDAILTSLDSEPEELELDSFVLAVLERLDYIARLDRRAEEEPCLWR